MMMRLQCLPFVFLVSFLFGANGLLFGQNILTDMDHDADHRYDRMIILSGGGDPMIHSSIKPFWRQDLVSLADSFSLYAQSVVDSRLIQSIYDQNNEFVRPAELAPSLIQYSDSSNTFYSLSEGSVPRYRLSKKSIWNTFFRTPAHFYEVDVKDFYLRVNPLLYLNVGRDTKEGTTLFTNQRGLSLRGGIGKNVFFQTNFLDCQARYPDYVNEFTDAFGVVPGVGLYKDYKSSLFHLEHSRDFLLANAYVGISLGKYIGIELGHNQFFIGDGIRSLLLSDFSTPFFSLKINTRIWKFHYQNIFAELAADNFLSVPGFSGSVPKKYMAAHYLSFKPNHTISVGLFETVIFNRPGQRFELQYLNPIILYRTVEGSIGSPDNVLLGLNARVDVRKTLSFYGQFILDDILIRNILQGHLDWWGNKFGHQLGLKYINFLGVANLDAQVEWNRVRPYTYSHYDANANYSNYKQPLAHPLGANFNEWIGCLRYQASARLLLQTNLYVIRSGEDADSVSFGGNVILPNTQRQGDFGNEVGQGVKTNILYWSSSLQFELTPGVFLDGQFLFRNKQSALPDRNRDARIFQLGVRYNMARREEVF